MVSKWATDFRENAAVVVPVVIGIGLCIAGVVTSDLAMFSLGAGIVGVPGFVKVSGGASEAQRP